MSACEILDSESKAEGELVLWDSLSGRRSRYKDDILRKSMSMELNRVVATMEQSRAQSSEHMILGWMLLQSQSTKTHAYDYAEEAGDSLQAVHTVVHIEHDILKNSERTVLINRE